MTILKNIFANLDDYLVILVFIFAISKALIVTITKVIPKWKAMPEEEKIAYIQRLLENLLPIAIDICTEAEITYGKGTGKLKYSYVMGRLYSYIPDAFKPYINEGNLKLILETALSDAKLEWDKNPNIQKILF